MKYKKPAKFREGDVVRVRSKSDVLSSVDTPNKFLESLFVDQILDYCGKQFKVYKILYHYFDEHKYRMFKVIEPLYMLDGLICYGEDEMFEVKCNRSCYLFLHETWLEKV